MTQTIHGCDSLEVLTLTVNHSDTAYFTEIACDSYEWHGIEYTTSGTYEYLTQTIHGCDSLEVLTLTVNHSDTAYFTEVACDSYLWHGVEYTTSGTYEYLTQTIHGCDSLEVLTLTINGNTQYSDETATACDTYTWNGETYTASGEYTYTTTAANGCDSIVTLHLTINKSEREEYTAVACDEYVWNGVTYPESGDYTYNTTTATGCERVEVLHLTINKSEREEYTATACDEYVWNGVTYTESGDYTYNTTTATGCERVEILHLTILPDATTETEELALCPSELPYEWFGQSLSEAGFYTATEPYIGTECDSVVHELTLNVYVQTLPEQVTLPIAREGEAVDVSVPTAEIQAYIAADTWYAPNASIEWYILGSDWEVLTGEPVEKGTSAVFLKYVVDTDCGSVESDQMMISVETSALENIPTDVMGVYKVLRDNKIFIIRGGKAYSIMGHLVGDKSVIDPAVTIQ